MRMVGKNVSLRPIGRDDLPSMFKWMNDPEVTLYADDDPHPSQTREDIEEQYRQETEEWADSMKRFIIETTAGHPIGTIMYRAYRKDTRGAWAGITIGEKSFWGKGYGPEAICLLLAYLFTEMKVHRVSVTVSDFNGRAIRAYEKCGFRSDGVLRDNALIDGKYIDHFVMSILENEYFGHVPSAEP